MSLGTPFWVPHVLNKAATTHLKSEYRLLLCCAGERVASTERHTARWRNRFHVATLTGGCKEVPYPAPSNRQPLASRRHSFR